MLKVPFENGAVRKTLFLVALLLCDLGTQLRFADVDLCLMGFSFFKPLKKHDPKMMQRVGGIRNMGLFRGHLG